MKFTPLEGFKLWEEDRLLAAYQPGLGYTVREGNDRLRALLLGGVLPGSHTMTVEKPDLSQTEFKPGDQCPGWVTLGLASITGFGGGSGVAGAAEVKKEG